MKILALLLLALSVTGCNAAPAVTIKRASGDVVTMPADVYAHSLSVEAYAASATGDAECYRIGQEVAKAGGDPTAVTLACQRNGGGSQQQAPQYVRGPSGFDRFAQVAGSLAPFAGAALNYVGADRANRRASELALRQSEVNAGREVAIAQAFQGTATAGFNSIGNTATNGFASVRGVAESGFSGIADVAGTGFVALETLGSNAVQAQAESAARSSEAWAATVAAMPPTYSLGAGAVFGDGNTVVNGGGSIDRSTVGRDRDVSRNCVATATSSTTGTQNASAGGTTGPSTGALGFTVYPQPSAPVECGG